MMLAVPQVVIDVGTMAGVFTAVVTAIAVFWRTPPVRWFRAHISESLGQWLKERINEAHHEHNAFVRYHLGPNGDAKPIHQRITDVERAVTTPPLPMVDWHGPYDDIGQHEGET